MKKFYTLLAGAMLASSAFALTPAQHQLKNVDLSSLTPQKLEKINPQMIQSGNNGMMKIQDATGKDWSCLIGITGDFVDILGLDSFNEYPYYWMQIAAQPMDGTDSLLQFIVVWPSRAAVLAEQDPTLPIFTETEDGLLLNEAEVLKHFGSVEEGTKAASFDEFQAIFDDGKITLEMLPGCYYTPCILAGSYTGALIKWNGTRYCPMSAINNNGQWDYSNVTTIVWESFDMDTNDIAIDFDVPYTTYTENGNYIIPGTNRVSIASAQLSGPATMLGFSDILYPALEEVHIFNAGRMTYGINEHTWSYSTAFDPLNYYFICFCDPTMAYMVQNQAGEKDQNFTNTTLPVYNSTQGAMIGAPGWAVDQNYNFTFMKAALWAPENSEKPYGMWSMAASDYTVNDDRTVKYKSPAKAYNLVEALNCAAGINDGFSGTYNGYSVDAVAEQSWLGVGDKNNGMNFKFASNLTNGYYFMGSFKGDILYHPTPNKWLDDITLLPAVGNESFDALSQGGNTSVKEVVSDAPVVSTSYYNFQGQRLASEPQQGLYIVRSVKADGTVVSKKVAK